MAAPASLHALSPSSSTPPPGSTRSGARRHPAPPGWSRMRSSGTGGRRELGGVEYGVEVHGDDLDEVELLDLG